MVIKINNIINILKRFIFSFMLLFGLNVIVKSFGFIIPINFINITVTALLGMPGLVGLILLKFLFFL